jgi:CheY-like chemotaxis protein
MEKPNRDVLSGWDIMVVDDDPKSLDVASRILSHYGATVHRVMNGQEALDLLKTIRPKFIVSDLSMPVMDGWVLISRLRELSAYSDIPVIALSAHAMTGDHERVVAAGFHGYLSKPLSPATFITDVLKILKNAPNLGLSWSG